MEDVNVVNENNIKVFVDEPLESIIDDEFGHKHYVEVIKNIIDNSNHGQLNIGLFGKWGVGKTTIINLLNNQFAHEKGFKTVMFECWKYSNEPVSLKRKFLLEVAKQTGEPIDELMDALYLKSNREIKNHSMLLSQDSIQNSIKNIMKGLMSSLIVLIIAEIISRVILYNFFGLEGEVSKSIFFNAAVISILYYAVKILKDYASNVTITKSNENLESLEQFEKEFKKIIKNVANKEGKIIVFVDDLDRCQSRKVIEILETIKAFMNMKNCIFIIACDDKLLKDALKEENINDMSYLDKIFQIKITIPPFRKEKIRDYAFNLIKNSNIKIPDEQLNEIIYVLIYKNALSPRKVKIILNNYILLYTIFQKRCHEGKYISCNFNLDLRFLAKVSVLQTEFIELYYDLEKNNRLLEFIEKVRREDYSSIEESQIDILSKYYNISGETYNIKDDFKKEIDYLYYTSSYIVSREHIKTYIYLSQDLLNTSYSDEYVENLELLLISKNVKDFVVELGKTKGIDERIEIFKNLLLRFDLYENLDLLNILISMTDSNIVNYIPNDISGQIAVSILSKMQQYKKYIKQFDIKGVVHYIDIINMYDFYSDVINEYINSLTLDDLSFSVNVIKCICTSPELKCDVNCLDKFLVKLYEIDHVKILNLVEELCDNKKALEKYFSNNIFIAIMDFPLEYTNDNKIIIAKYLKNICDKMTTNILIEKVLKFVNDDNKVISIVCIEIIDNIIKSEENISKYIEKILETISINEFTNIDTCRIIFNMIIKIGLDYELNDEIKNKLVIRLCEQYLKSNETFVKCYIMNVHEVVSLYGNIDHIISNISQVINSLKITDNSSRYLPEYINSLKDLINSTQKNVIYQTIYNIINNQIYQANNNVMEFIYSLLIDCSFIIENEKETQLSSSLINIANAQQRGQYPVNAEIVKLTYITFNKLKYLFTDSSINKFFNSLLSKLEGNLIYDFAVNQFIQNYKMLYDETLREKILTNIISKDPKEINEDPNLIIDIFNDYGSVTIFSLLDLVFNFISLKFDMFNKIEFLCNIISKLEITKQEIELKVLLSLLTLFEEEVQKNVFREMLFINAEVRKNTINLFIEGKVDFKYIYTLKIVSEKIVNEDERFEYNLLIEQRIKNTILENEIANLLNILIALRDTNNYLRSSNANNVISNIYIYLLEGGMLQKKAALDTLNLYYNEKRFPRRISSKIALLLKDIITNDNELREKAIDVATENDIYKKYNELRNIIESTSTQATAD